MSKTDSNLFILFKNLAQGEKKDLANLNTAFGRRAGLVVNRAGRQQEGKELKGKGGASHLHLLLGCPPPSIPCGGPALSPSDSPPCDKKMFHRWQPAVTSLAVPHRQGHALSHLLQSLLRESKIKQNPLKKKREKKAKNKHTTLLFITKC